MLVVTGGLPFPGNLLSRQFQVMENSYQFRLEQGWTRVRNDRRVPGLPRFEAPRRGGEAALPAGISAAAERSLHSPRTHAHRRRGTDTVSESLQIPKHKKGRLYRSSVTYLDFC